MSAVAAYSAEAAAKAGLAKADDSGSHDQRAWPQFSFVTRQVWRGCEPRQTRNQLSNSVLSDLFKPRSSPPAAKGGEEITVRVEELDRSAIDEAVGIGEIHICSQDK